MLSCAVTFTNHKHPLYALDRITGLSDNFDDRHVLPHTVIT
jgi:hypothetical protein